MLASVKRRSTIAGIVAFTLVVETAVVAQAEEPAPPEPAATDIAPPEDNVGTSPAAPMTAFSVFQPSAIDVTGRLALAAPASLARSGGLLTPVGPAPIMSKNAKTVLIVAIIAGAVLILAGAIVVGKPFKKL